MYILYSWGKISAYLWQFQNYFPYANKIALIQSVYTAITKLKYRVIITIIREHIEVRSE